MRAHTSDQLDEFFVKLDLTRDREAMTFKEKEDEDMRLLMGKLL